MSPIRFVEGLFIKSGMSETKRNEMKWRELNTYIQLAVQSSFCPRELIKSDEFSSSE